MSNWLYTLDTWALNDKKMEAEHCAPLPQLKNKVKCLTLSS